MKNLQRVEGVGADVHHVVPLKTNAKTIHDKLPKWETKLVYGIQGMLLDGQNGWQHFVVIVIESHGWRLVIQVVQQRTQGAHLPSKEHLLTKEKKKKTKKKKKKTKNKSRKKNDREEYEEPKRRSVKKKEGIRGVFFKKKHVVTVEGTTQKKIIALLLQF